MHPAHASVGDDFAMRLHTVMMHNARPVRKGEMHYEPHYGSGMETPADRLRAARVKAGYETAKSAAEAMGVTVSTYIQHENGSRGFPASRAARYAKFLRVAPEWLLYGRGQADPVQVEPELSQLPVVGPVQAGAWLAVDDLPQDDPPTMPVMLDRRYLHARQWLREVRGDSMNARNILPGDFAHLVDITEAGVNLNTGMIVEVTRHRDGGGLREITLKEVELTRDGILLWPRSTNPKWRDPVAVDPADGADVEVQITGLLIAKITRF
jgi:SOS-response transcriptional repressor LexA